MTRLVEEKYAEIIERNRHRAVDGRAETHLQVCQMLLGNLLAGLESCRRNL